MSVGPWQILIILVIVLLLFGGNRLGEIGKGLGEGIKNFKKGIADDGQKPVTRRTDAQVVGETPGADHSDPAPSGSEQTSSKQSEG